MSYLYDILGEIGFLIYVVGLAKIFKWNLNWLKSIHWAILVLLYLGLFVSSGIIFVLTAQ